MSIDLSQVKVVPYQFPLSSPIILQSGKTLAFRKGLYLYYPFERNNVLISEVAPLPTFSQESLDEIYHEFNAKKTVSPSLQFGLDMLSILYEALTKKMSLFKLFQSKLGVQSDCLVNIASNHLLLLNSSRLLNQIEDAINKGSHVIKLKVGYRSFPDEYLLLKRILETYSSRCLFRIDPNEQWSSKDLNFFCETMPMDCIEYIEDPVSSWDELMACKSFFSKIALDHLFHKLSLTPEQYQWFSYIIIKPTLLGGIAQLKQLKECLHPSQKIIVTHSFESPIAHYYLNLIAQLFSPELTHGLALNYYSEK